MKRLEKHDGTWVLRESEPVEDAAALLRIGHTDDLLANPPRLNGIEAVRLDWPEFKFGQAFTQARLLRERYGFDGQIRAGGKLFRDQAWHAARCGVDAFELGETATEDEAEGWRRSLTAYQHHYQPAVTGTPAWRLRAGTDA